MIVIFLSLAVLGPDSHEGWTYQKKNKKNKKNSIIRVFSARRNPRTAICTAGESEKKTLSAVRWEQSSDAIADPEV